MKKILLPTDFSINAQNAFDYAIHVFGTRDVEYHLLNTYIEPHTNANILLNLIEVLSKQSKEDLDQEHERIIRDFPDFDITLHIHSEYGSLTANIERLVKEEEVDLIVMGTKGATGLKKALIGSNAADVIKHKVCPTLIVPENNVHQNINKVLVGLDTLNFEDGKSIKTALNIVHCQDLSIQFAHVEEGGTDVSKYSKNLEENLSSEIKDIGYEIVSIDDTDVVNGIMNYLDVNSIGLLIMIVRKHSFMERLFQESKTSQMAMLTKTPLLIIHEE